ncbi:MAG TPA: hypothetical protein VIJ12_07090 [Candidatus Baltobacteraceae bacterium]
MRPIPIAALLLALALLPPTTGLQIAATAASTLFEAVPFILAARLVAAILPRASHWLPFLGCGCSGGPSARSVPATIATALAFGPLVALARFLAAYAMGIATRGVMGDTSPHRDNALGTLSSLLPFAIVAGVVSHVLPMLYSFSHANAIVAWIGGALLGLALSPCGLGVVGIAGALRGVSPAACVGFLCVTGVVDVRSLFPHRDAHVGHDACAYLLAALACALVAWHGGAMLVHPHFTLPLLACGAALAVLAYKHRRERDVRAMLAPALAFAVAVAGAPPPDYRATPTTLADAFPGERLSFTGVVARTGKDTSLVRYAITCCRADAAPIAVPLAASPPSRTGTWLDADGTLVPVNGSLRLRVDRAKAVAPPSDPFLYR